MSAGLPAGPSANPAGLAVCFNVPFLEPSTGVFATELWIFNTSSPAGAWVGVQSADIRLQLSFPAADVQLIGIAPDQATPTQQVKVLRYAGQFKQSIRDAHLPVADLHTLLNPSIQLSATNPAGLRLDLPVSAEQPATFVNGVFSTSGAAADQAVDPPTAPRPGSAAAVAAILANIGPAKIPGLTFGIFPLGLIITLFWTGAFIAIVGSGSVYRAKFRSHYRQRVRRQLWNHGSA